MRSDTTLADAIDQAQRLEVIQKGYIDPWSDPGKSNRSNWRERENTSQSQYVPMELDGTKSKGRPTVKCYNCGKLGHIKRNCRLKPVTMLRRPGGPQRIRAADLGEEYMPAPNAKIKELEAQLAAQNDAISTMYKLMQSEHQEKVKD